MINSPSNLCGKIVAKLISLVKFCIALHTGVTAVPRAVSVVHGSGVRTQ